MKTAPTSILKKSLAYFLAILMLFQSVGCTYFRDKKVSSDFAASIHNIGEIHKYFIVHDGSETYELTDIIADSMSMSGNLHLISDTIFYSRDRNKHFKKYEKDILHEVHIYLNQEAEALQLGQVEIPLTDLKELRIIEMDEGVTIVSYTLITIGLVVILVALTKSSCPYVYVNNGEAFVFEGETYGGAIAANLERDDYLPLPSIRPVNGTYQMYISNELKERQYTDLAELIFVNHQVGQRAMLDKYGKPHLLESPQSAVKASSYSGEDLMPALNEKDKEVFLFNDEAYSQNGIILKFEKPQNATEGKLLLNGKNTLWFDYLFGAFLSKFGSSYDSFMDRQSQIPGSERMQKMLENDFPLSIYIKQNGAWQLIDYLFTVGPLASRDFVIPVDLSAYAAGEIEIKIETGFMFWELDYAAMDFTEKADLDLHQIKAFEAYGTGSQDWTSALKEADKQYMAQENVGEVTKLIFEAPPISEGEVQSVFLHTRGYYELIREFEGLPKITELNKFKTPGYFSDFSRASYLKVLDKEDELASIKQVAN